MPFVLTDDLGGNGDGSTTSVLDGYEVSDEVIKEQARLTLELADRAGDIIPEFMKSVAINEFPNVDYIMKSIVISQLDPELDTLRHKYKDYFEWADAMEIWNDAMDRLVKIYGTEEWVKVALKEDIIPNVLPPKPELKLTKKNKRILRSGVLPVRREPYPFTDEQMQRLAAVYAPITEEMRDAPDEDFFIDISQLPKKARKLWDKVIERKFVGARKDSIYKSSGINDPSLDAIKNFMASGSYSKFNERGEDYEDMAIMDRIAEWERYEGWNDIVVEHILGENPITWSAGRLQRYEEVESLEVIRYLMDQGFNIDPRAVKNNKYLSKRAVAMITGELAAMREDGPMTKKERKALRKMKKKADKERRARAQKKLDAEEALSRALADPTTTFRDASGGIMSLADRLSEW